MKKEDHQPTPTVTLSTKQRLVLLLQDISQAVDHAKTIEAAFDQVLTQICRFMDWPLGHVLVLSDAADVLVSSRIWYSEDPLAFVPFRQLSESMQFHHGKGMVGLVWESAQPVSVLDVHTEKMFARCLPVEEGGICAYFAFPIKVEGQVTAVLEFFSPESIAPDPDVTTIITYVGTMLALAIQRQQILSLLHTSETQLAEAQKTAHVGHWEWDVLRDQITWSPELYRIYGVTSDDFQATYLDFLSRVHPDDVTYVQKKVLDAYENGRSFDYFHRIIRPGGSVRVIRARGRAINDTTGRIIKLYGTAQDMTEQKETELILAQTVRTLSALMEIGQTVAATLDLEVIYNRVLSLGRPLLKAEALMLFENKDDMLEVVAMDQDNISDMRGLRIPLNSGIAGEVWTSGRSLFLQGEECMHRLAPALKGLSDYRPQAIIAVPLRSQDKAVGILEATHREKDTFDENDIHLLETVAAWTAIAIGNARQYEQLQRRLRESDALITISNALTKTFDLPSLLQIIVNEAESIIPQADWAIIHLLQPSSHTLELAASAGVEIDATAYSINLNEGIAAQVIVHGGVINIADMENDPRRLTIDSLITIHSLLVVPVEGRHSRIGTISLQCATPAAFTTDDERLLTIFGVQAGLAIENARLYDAQQQARQKAEKQRERMRHMAKHVVESPRNGTHPYRS